MQKSELNFIGTIEASKAERSSGNWFDQQVKHVNFDAEEMPFPDGNNLSDKTHALQCAMAVFSNFPLFKPLNFGIFYFCIIYRGIYVISFC